MSHEAWVTRFGSDQAMLGRQIVINGTSFTVVGVTVPKMPTPMFSEPPDVMVPIGYYPNAHGLDRGTRGIAVVGRIKPGVTIDAAQRDLQAIERQLAQAYPTTNAGTSAEVVSLRDYTVGSAKAGLFIIVGAVLAVLLIACANVANLQLARGASRARELSVRADASRFQGDWAALYRRGATVPDPDSERSRDTAPKFQLPDERYGLVFVFRIFDNVSYALVMESSRPLTPGDVVQTP